MKKFRNLLITVLLLSVVLQSPGQTQLPVSVDRPMYAAGKFYPASPEELRAILKKLFSEAQKNKNYNIQAVIAPHAGYQFSGKIAAGSYNQIDPNKEYDNIFIIGSSHNISFDGASVYSAGDYLTPLGKIPVNREIASKLISENPVFSFVSEADENEHSLEVQLPFLQYHMKKGIRLVPVIIGTKSEETCKLIAKALLPWFNEKNLFIISTDFSHYPSAVDARKVDKATSDIITANSPVAFLESIKKTPDMGVNNLATRACGWTSVLTLMYMTATDPAIVYKQIAYMNSGDAGGDQASTVGYWSIAVTRSAGKEQGWINISDQDRRAMTDLARTTLEKYFDPGNKSINWPDTSGKVFRQHYGAFVTLRINSSLRGCVGRIQTKMPLSRLISEMAVAAATEDLRFRPLTAAELSETEIEISVLSPLKKVKSPGEVDISKHGVLIRKGENEGTLLPQVAREYHLTREELLRICSEEKAGLGPDGWKTADIYVYEAVDISEKDFTANRN